MARPKGKGKKGVAAVAKPKKATATKRKASAAAAATGKSVARDVYSDDDDDAQEEKRNAKMDIDGVYEYEQPETFEHDSEIDEDEAFDSDDEQAYGGFFQSKPAKQGAKNAELSDGDNEEDDVDDDDDAAGGDLLSDLLGTTSATRLSTRQPDNNEATGDADDSALENSDDEDAGEPKNLSALADGLVPERKKKKLAEIALDSSVTADASGELTLSALLGGADADATTGDDSGLNLSKVKKQVRDLETDGGAALQAAVAPVLEERATRQLAYAEKKDDVDLFQTVVRRNRQKETMDFREQTPKMENLTAASLTSKFSAQTVLEKDVAALLKASDLNDRAIAEEEQAELAQLKVSKAEVVQRQQELAKMRALLFYEEQKQKRVKKIKSKLYHKIRNSQDKKQAEKQREQLRALDPALADALDRELAEKRAEERMTLKHTNTSKWVKHQLKRGTLADNGTRGAIAEQLRRGDELRRKVHAAGSDDDDDEEDEDEDDADQENRSGDAVTRLQKRLEKQAGALVLEIDGDEARAGQATGLAGMKFMQRAVQKQREKARVEAEKLLRELKGDVADGDGLLSDGDALSSGDEGGVKTTTTTSSRKKTKKTSKKRVVAVATEADKQAVAKALPTGALQTGSVSMDKGLSARASGAIAVDLGDGVRQRQATDVATVGAVGQTIELGAKAATPKSQSKSKGNKAATATEEAEKSAVPAENPWLSTASASTKSKKRNKKSSASKQDQSGASVASAIASLSKAVAKAGDTAAADNALSLLTGGDANSAKRSNSSKKRTLEQPAAGAVATAGADTSGPTSTKKAKTNDGDKATPTPTSQKPGKKPTQEELVRRAFAFADEDEESELTREKEQLAAQDTDAKKGAEIAKLVGLSGWGSWAGDGVKQSFRHKVRVERAQQLAAATKAQVLAGRKDAKMARVLISEKKDKRAAKFTVQDVPYPFTSREEYEMAMRNPLGSDWNTPASTSALTVPRVIKRAGTIIQPLKLTKADKKEAKKELSKQRKAKF